MCGPELCAGWSGLSLAVTTVALDADAPLLPLGCCSGAPGWEHAPYQPPILSSQERPGAAGRHLAVLALVSSNCLKNNVQDKNRGWRGAVMQDDGQERDHADLQVAGACLLRLGLLCMLPQLKALLLALLHHLGSACISRSLSAFSRLECRARIRFIGHWQDVFARECTRRAPGLPVFALDCTTQLQDAVL